MEKHSDFNDLEFEELFNNCKLNPDVFNHEAHLRLAWIHINKYGIEVASENLHKQLKRFVKNLGAEDKYNKTLTLAASKVVHHFFLKSKSNSFEGFICEFPQLNSRFKELMESHYSAKILYSNLAKTKFLEPDILSFD